MLEGVAGEIWGREEVAYREFTWRAKVPSGLGSGSPCSEVGAARAALRTARPNERMEASFMLGGLSS